jgi:hypothetical protein
MSSGPVWRDNARTPMHVILWTGTGVLGFLIVVLSVLHARRDPAPDTDLGSISVSWLNEHKATHGDGKS